MNAFFDGYVNSKTTLKQFVEQYDNALRSKVEKETKADFKSRNKLYDCLTVYEFEKQFRAAYTNAKFKKVQVELKRLLYCHATLVKEEGSICTYHAKEAVLVGEKMKKVEFLVYFNSTEFEMQRVCRWFEFRGIMCAHSLNVLIERCIYEVPNKYIMPRWRKDLERGYICIPTTYTKSGSVLNAKVHDNYHKTLDEIIEIASNDDGSVNDEFVKFYFQQSTSSYYDQSSPEWRQQNEAVDTAESTPVAEDLLCESTPVADERIQKRLRVPGDSE
ncbi:protein FAR-RED IMPAIRED RESPONSE 1-like [Camellia sinensis]|uniref:protein FAR-RED IMPAIRED RESPONSE 1-like n=1 Tax=Camellia sinensis TaxID=4442 RepID=UPI0010360F95|nr:protein FAR-RED IMPAIRED RESPONSE 1-like [Camellia sinensis]